MPQAFWTIVLAFSMVAAYPYLHENVPFLQAHFRTYNKLDEILLQANKTSEQAALPPPTVKPQEMPRLDAQDSTLTVQAVQRIEALTPEEVKTYTGGATALAKFHAALQRVRKGGKCRIAYYGDSMIEGDLVTQSVRNELQKAFGGIGVGFVPMTSITNSFRRTVVHAFSPNWQTFNYLLPKKKQPYGISGEYFLASPGSWVQYKASKQYAGVSSLTRPTLLYGKFPTDTATKPLILAAAPSAKADSASATIDSGKLSQLVKDTANTRAVVAAPPMRPSGKSPLAQRNYVVVTRPNKPADTLELNPVAALNELRLSDTATQDIRLDFHLQAKIPLFGVDFEGGSGIYVDNFSSRGNTGQSLQALPSAMLKGIQAQHPYDLIVLQFGLNMIDSTRTNYYTYQQNLVRVITHLQQQFPNTAILVVGVSDKASKIKGEMQTNPCVPLISAAQRNAAIQTGAAFYNLFEAMGGYGAMVRWVNATPALANKDYTHPNHLGAHKIAGMITKYLLTDFKEQP